METEKKQRRPRRSAASIENDIVTATRALVEKSGFSNITLTGIIHQAGIEPQVFYNRFSDLESLFEQFTRKYDYWLSDLISVKRSRIK